MEKNLKLLVVDDDQVDRMAVRRALKKAGLSTEVTEAADCASAIVALTENNFDGAFLDYRLPDQNGLDLVKELRFRDIQIPLIVLTGQGDEEIAVQLMKAGASDYISKSNLTPDILSRRLSSALRIYQAERKVELANQRLRASNELLMTKNQQLEQQRQQIEQQNQELKQASRLKSQFLATMSHELRTPMNAIMGFSQMLLLQNYGELGKSQQDMVQRILNNSENLLELLNEILDFSKIEAGHLKLKPEPLNLTQLAKLTTEELRSLALRGKLTLETDINLDNPQIINDSGCIRRILTNLISNAIKFTNQGGVKVTVQELSPKEIEIAVADTGVGIAPENLETIFEAFRQVDGRITRQHPGTGLGLAITESLVKMMQGKITVTSELGKGSIFRIVIPRNILNPGNSKPMQ